MPRFIAPAMGAFFIVLAMLLLRTAVRDGRDPTGAWSIAARVRFKIAAIFSAVGVGLLGWHLMLP